MKPEALIRIRIIASVVFSFNCFDESQIGKKLNNKISEIKTFPKRENSSNKIFLSEV